MKQDFVKSAILGGILSVLMCLPTISLAIGLFNTSTGYLVIPEVDINGDTFLDDVTLKLDFATGTFEVVGFSHKPETISSLPLDTMEEQDIKLDFMGCARSGRNDVVCHVKLTSLGGFDRKIEVNVTDSAWSRQPTKLFDDQGNTYIASEVTVGNLQTTSSIDVTFIAGIPTLAKYKFNNISPTASSLSLFQPEYIAIGVDGGSFNGDFRNINF